MYRQNDKLAINGGKQVRTRLFAPWPSYEADEIAAASAVLRSGKVNYWTGNQGKLFEKEFATATRNTHAIAVANGTVALELALYALQIGVGDEVIVPSRSFVASASSDAKCNSCVCRHK
jgi:dTDP-4-amino-4,6-dideoxygalactose transaminase